eukprot:PITA_04213
MAQNAMARLCSFYGYAREKSGSLKHRVYAMEETGMFFVKKFEEKPLEILRFADAKVGNVINQLDSCLPQALKSWTCEIYRATKRTPEVSSSVVTQVRQVAVENIKEVGKTLYAKSESSAKNLYRKCEPVAEGWCLLAWYKLRQFPFVPQLVEALIPPTAYYVVQYLCDGNYQVAPCLHIVPVEKIESTIYRELARKEDQLTQESEDKVAISHSD